MNGDLDWDALPVGEYAFPGPLRDQLVSAMGDGTKTSTSSLVVEYELDGDPLPQVGDREAVVDSQGRPVLVTENTSVVVRRLADVPLQHAVAEGEGFKTVAAWRRGHEDFWHSDDYRESVGDPGFVVDDETLVVCVTFDVIARR